MKNYIEIKKKLNKIKSKSLDLPGDKSLSIRFVILSSLANGKSTAKNILKSEDVINTINCIKKLGIKVKLNNKTCSVHGKGLKGYKYKKDLIFDAGNSGTCARLFLSSLIDTDRKIKIIGDESLSKRDMKRVVVPLKEFGANIKDSNGFLPIIIDKAKNLKPIKYTENLGSAQCKSAVMIAALKTEGLTYLKCKSSRNHSELMFKNILKVPIKVKKLNGYDQIIIKGKKEFNSFNYKIPSDISSAAFFIALTLLTKNASLKLKNINTNATRTGFVKILKLMGANINYQNKRKINGEEVSDIIVKYTKNFKSIKLNPKYNSSAIDEFLLLFIVAGISKGISHFYNLSELNKKESRRLDWGLKILKSIGVKAQITKNYGIKIWGNPNLEIKKNIVIKDYMKDHRIFMVSVIVALSLGGNWKIYNPESIKTSFPEFIKLIKKVGGNIL